MSVLGDLRYKVSLVSGSRSRVASLPNPVIGNDVVRARFVFWTVRTVRTVGCTKLCEEYPSVPQAASSGVVSQSASHIMPEDVPVPSLFGAVASGGCLGVPGVRIASLLAHCGLVHPVCLSF